MAAAATAAATVADHPHARFPTRKLPEKAFICSIAARKRVGHEKKKGVKFATFCKRRRLIESTIESMRLFCAHLLLIWQTIQRICCFLCLKQRPQIVRVCRLSLLNTKIFCQLPKSLQRIELK